MPNLSHVPEKLKVRDREPDFMQMVKGYRVKWKSRMKGGEITDGEKFRDMSAFLTLEAQEFNVLADEMDKMVEQKRQEQAAARAIVQSPVPAPAVPPQPAEGVPFMATVNIEGKLTPTMLITRNGVTGIYSLPMPTPVYQPAPALQVATLPEIAAQEEKIEMWQDPTPPPTESAAHLSTGMEGKAQASPKSAGVSQAQKTSLNPQAESKEAQLKQNVPQQNQQENPSPPSLENLPKQPKNQSPKQNQPSEPPRKVLRRNGDYVDFVPDGISISKERHLKVAQ